MSVFVSVVSKEDMNSAHLGDVQRAACWTGKARPQALRLSIQEHFKSRAAHSRDNVGVHPQLGACKLKMSGLMRYCMQLGTSQESG